jgi:hypothetical protein
MDPQKLSQLDPKLRDAYQRVMGTTIPEPQAPPAQTQTPPAIDGSAALTSNPMSAGQPQPVMPAEQANLSAAMQPQSPSLPPEPITTPQPAINPQTQFVPTPDSAAQAQPTSNFVQMNSEVSATPTLNSPNFSAPAPQAVTLKKKNGMMPILFGIVGLVFIVIYTFFWTKIFNLKLPFLP